MAFELAVAGMRLESCPIYRHFPLSATFISVVIFALDGSMPRVATTPEHSCQIFAKDTPASGSES